MSDEEERDAAHDWDDGEEGEWNEANGEDGDSGDDADDDTIPCPYCRRPIHEDSVRCPYCEQYISSVDSPSRRRSWWIVVGVVLCAVILYFWIMR